MPSSRHSPTQGIVIASHSGKADSGEIVPTHVGVNRSFWFDLKIHVDLTWIFRSNQKDPLNAWTGDSSADQP